jgi:hypothetical protein
VCVEEKQEFTATYPRQYSARKRGSYRYGEFDDHQTVNHQIDEYPRGNVTTNTVEGYYLIFKRGMNRQRVRLNAARNNGFSATVSAGALKERRPEPKGNTE